ncbi:aldehyde dehydrogenase family protein [Paenibacillus lignilyticus]|uniref:Aldehyde dehydrogenase family protein n=1 Tax=Paenibacillus lignilyticus TaxID=1172615 RepID=A0ABS5CD80_9BACL|nr:aldehyde dehydrogenase family protein [Paenibacillus lignilyticus]MBP3963906.1 aldehyde dehydrogenase family protein [Paenibacillus lignilyticus]
MVKKQLYIGGQWLEAKSYTKLSEPYSGQELAEIPFADREETERAIEAAYLARGVMAKLPAHKRAAILETLSRLLSERAEEAARIIALEAAKPLKAAKAEVDRTIQTYKFAAEEAKRLSGEMIPLDAAPGGEGRIAYTMKEPIGVIGAITPFNFPMNLVAHKVGPAIASGNTIVLKPASQTPLSAFFLAELLEEAGLPAGALNVVTGSGSVIGDVIVKDDRVKAISFTGSPKVGIGIRNRAGLKRVALELGSNSALIIDKGVQLSKVISRCVAGAFSYQGQVCISLQRIYVHADSYDEFVARFCEAASKLKAGDPLDPDTDLSAMITLGDVSRALSWIDEAVEQGAIVACGGRTSSAQILQPTVLLEVDRSAKICCEEAFAPIVLINRIRDVEEGIAHINDSRYGLHAGIYTDNIHTALDAAEKLHVGGVLINDIPTFRVDHMPYGGVKESGLGREGVKYAIGEMTEIKTVIINRT